MTNPLADFLDYVLPVFFEGLVDAVVRWYPIVFIIIVVFLFVLWRRRKFYLRKNIEACEAARGEVVASYRKSTIRNVAKR